MRVIKGISEGFGRKLEWGSCGWDMSKMVKPVSPALRATDYKSPKYVWFVEETE